MQRSKNKGVAGCAAAAKAGLRGGQARPTAMAAALGAMSVFAPWAAQTEDGNRGGAATLDTVVITASGFEQTVADAPASITVVPRAELEKRAYKDVTDALRDVPGVVVTGGGSSSDISIRGMAAATPCCWSMGAARIPARRAPTATGRASSKAGCRR